MTATRHRAGPLPSVQVRAVSLSRQGHRRQALTPPSRHAAMPLLGSFPFPTSSSPDLVERCQQPHVICQATSPPYPSRKHRRTHPKLWTVFLTAATVINLVLPRTSPMHYTTSHLSLNQLHQIRHHEVLVRVLETAGI